MSNTQYVFLMRDKMPNREALQESINALGFDLMLHPDFTPFTDSGFSPCILNGVSDVGFEVLYEAASEIEGLKHIAGANDLCMEMTWHSSMQDCACAMIVSCALARDFGAVVSYEGDDPEPFEKLFKGAKEVIKLVESESA